MLRNTEEVVDVEACVPQLKEAYAQGEPPGYRGEGEGQLLSFLLCANLA